MRFDIVVLGGGPAALAAAASCSSSGLAVARVEPPGRRRPWPAGGAWLDELDGLGLGAAVARCWDDVRIVTSDSHQISRPYCLLDGERLASLLREQSAGTTVIEGRAVGANHDRWQSTVVLHDARLVDGIVVVDATGAWPAIVHRSDEGDEPRPGLAAATRTTVDIVARCRPDPGPLDACVLMGRTDDEWPSWGSTFDLGDGRWLVRQTALAPSGAARPEPAALEARLRGRLGADGVVLDEVTSVDHAVVPIGLPIPAGRQRTVGFGAASSMVDPRTGWSVGPLLRAAPAMAEAIVAALDRRATPAGISAAAWGAVWPAERRRARTAELRLLRTSSRLARAGRAIESPGALDVLTQASGRADVARGRAWVRRSRLGPPRLRPWPSLRRARPA